MAGFLLGFCLAQSATTAVICCLNPDCASDSFAGETAERELSKPPFPHPPLSSSQSLLGHLKNCKTCGGLVHVLERCEIWVLQESSWC